MKFTLGFSPCPNDTFIFDALVNKKIDTEGLEFEVVMEDVENLNQRALTKPLDISKLSFPAFFKTLNRYVMLDSGAALGNGVGPLLIANRTIRNPFSAMEQAAIALPGENTTAHLLFSFAFPHACHKIFLRFDQIEDFVLGKPLPGIAPVAKEKAGVIIHENRFTYQQKGLQKVMDLGEYWENKTNLPVPLGGIAVLRTMDKQIALKIEKLIHKSIQLAFENYPKLAAYVKQHAQEMNEEVMRKHIELYVTGYSLSLGHAGRTAIYELYKSAASVLPVAPAPSSGHLFLS